jgi:hypothetical protein
MPWSEWDVSEFLTTAGMSVQKKLTLKVALVIPPKDKVVKVA